MMKEFEGNQPDLPRLYVDLEQEHGVAPPPLFHGVRVGADQQYPQGV